MERDIFVVLKTCEESSYSYFFFFFFFFFFLAIFDRQGSFETRTRFSGSKEGFFTGGLMRADLKDSGEDADIRELFPTDVL